MGSNNNYTFISCAKWIRRGVAKPNPDIMRFTKEEMKSFADKINQKKDLECNRNNNDDSKGSASNKKNQISDDTTTDPDDEFNWEDYDNEEDTDVTSLERIIDFDNISSNEEEEEEDSDDEDDKIKPSDNLIAVGQVHEDASLLKVYVYNEESGDQYVHHDMILPSTPLALEWLSHDPTQTSGNLLAVGGLTPLITIWNLDIVNSLDPLLTLGTFSRLKKDRHRNHGHKGAVLDLSWNPKLPHALASGSIDKSVLLWDLDKAIWVTQFNKFQDKVQSIEWHPTEVNLLIAGDCNSSITLLDCRLEEILTTSRVSGDVEKIIWHPTNQCQVLIGTSAGMLYCRDLRSKKSLWKIQAHSKEVTGIGIHEESPMTALTCSMDQTVKLWDLSNTEPLLVNEKNAKQGLQCLQMCPENADIFCIGGDGKPTNFKIYNVEKDFKEAKLTEMDTES